MTRRGERPTVTNPSPATKFRITRVSESETPGSFGFRAFLFKAGDAELARLIAAVESAADAVRAHADEALRTDADRNQPGLF